MEFTNEELGCIFSIPDRPNVRQQLAYNSRVAEWVAAPLYIRLWLGACALIETWECERLKPLAQGAKGGEPGTEMDRLRFPALSELTNPSLARLVIWVGRQVLGHMNSLEDVDPN